MSYEASKSFNRRRRLRHIALGFSTFLIVLTLGGIVLVQVDSRAAAVVAAWEKKLILFSIGGYKTPRSVTAEGDRLRVRMLDVQFTIPRDSVQGVRDLGTMYVILLTGMDTSILMVGPVGQEYPPTTHTLFVEKPGGPPVRVDRRWIQSPKLELSLFDGAVRTKITEATLSGDSEAIEPIFDEIVETLRYVE